MDRDECAVRGWSREICKLQSRLLNRKGQEQGEGKGEGECLGPTGVEESERGCSRGGTDREGKGAALVVK